LGVVRILELINERNELAEKVITSDTLYAELVYASETQSVAHLDDLLLRRTRLGLVLPRGGEEVLSKIKTYCQDSLAWDDMRWQQEAERYQNIIASHYSLPTNRFEESNAKQVTS
jgi:glycerol-3-phosphate dehydrogenase